MALAAGGRPARARRLPAGLAWALWALAMLSQGVIWWLDHLLRQAGRSDLAPLGAGVVAPGLAAVSAATVGAVLASVLAQLLVAPDMRIGFADCYLDALDRLAGKTPARANRGWPPMSRDRDRRTAELAEWHRLLLDWLIGSEAEDRLDRLADHSALGRPGT